MHNPNRGFQNTAFKYTLLFGAITLAGALQAATITVTNTNDSLAGSLRQAIHDAFPGDKIVFNIPTSDAGYNVTTQSFTVTTVSGALAIAKNLTIDGTGARIVVARSNAQGTPLTSVFSVTAVVVVLNNLNITGGNANSGQTPAGGGIYNTASLTLRNCSLYSNLSPSSGGGVYNTGTLTVSNCTIANNSSAGVGGGIYNAAGADLTSTASTVTGNSSSGGVAIYSRGTAHIGNSVLLNTTSSPTANTCVDGAFTSSGYNFVSYLDGSTGFGLNGSHDQFGTTGFPADAKLDVLADNGGWTKTMMPLPISPLIDQGNSFGLTVDQRGRRRPIDNPTKPNASDSADVGAAEADVPQSGPIFTVNTNDEHSDQLCGVQDCSLWDAANASGDYARNTGQRGTITFASNVRGTITTALQAEGIIIQPPVKIAGPGASVLTISGAGVARVFHIVSGATNIEISGLKIANGSISDYGGGILNEGELSLSNCILSNNDAPGFSGGALFNAATMTLTDVTVSANSAYSGGGISSTGTCTATNVTMSGNSATNGGGMFVDSGTANLINVTLSGNSAINFGGGISSSATTNLTNVTLSGNSATTGGGIYNNGSITLTNTVIAKGPGGANCAGGSAQGGFNLSDDNTCGFTKPGDPLQRDDVTDLRLGSLTYNGGFTQTHLPQAGSRTIDHGTASGAPATDQRGVGRPAFGGFDVGAVEYLLVTENTNTFVQYDGWRGFKNTNANGGAYRQSNVTNDAATYAFSGTSIKWITRKGPDMGKALVTIDGASQGTFDLYSSSTLWNQQILFSNLSSGSHTIVIAVTGTKNASATDFNVALDGFLVGSATKAVQESVIGIKYNTWAGKTQTLASGGSYTTSATVGAVARFRFNGTTVNFVTARGPSYGGVNIYIDGVLKSSNIDLYAATQQWQYWLNYSGLANTNHTIEVRPTHTKNAKSKGYDVVVDSFTGPVTALP